MFKSLIVAASLVVMSAIGVQAAQLPACVKVSHDVAKINSDQTVTYSCRTEIAG